MADKKKQKTPKPQEPVQHVHTINLNIRLENVEPALEGFRREGKEIEIELRQQALALACRAGHDPAFREFIKSALGIV